MRLDLAGNGIDRLYHPPREGPFVDDAHLRPRHFVRLHRGNDGGIGRRHMFDVSRLARRILDGRYRCLCDAKASGDWIRGIAVWKTRTIRPSSVHPELLKASPFARRCLRNRRRPDAIAFVAPVRERFAAGEHSLAAIPDPAHGRFGRSRVRRREHKRFLQNIYAGLHMHGPGV